ncbi:MAG: alpha/beta hydrolase fold domain-containing protein [Roseibacillus sp.]
MKRTNLIFVTALVLAGVTNSTMAEGNPLEKQILKLQPQADKNGDGKLSKAEEAALHEMILKRYPKADADGDGVLSIKEQQAVIRRATARAKRQGQQTPSSEANKSKGTNPPTHANVKYGEHERNVFDIWLADSDNPTPLAIYIHGGGFRAGSKEKLKPNELDQLLKAGISVAAINYRYKSVATPLPTPHHDARRALQFMRSKAKEWNIDKDRVAAFGGSAGAQICMWLAYSDEMAKPDSKDPIERESTRLTCVATSGGQTTNDSEFWQNKIAVLLGPDTDVKTLSRPLGNIRDPEKVRIATWGAKTLDEAKEIARRHSALSIVSADDPPIFMSYGMTPTAKPPTDKGRIRGWLIHHVNLGIALKERTDALEVEAHLKYPGAETKYKSQVEFFVDKLLKK